MLAPLDERGERLIEDVSRVFFSRGIRSVSMDDLARELGISKKTIYVYVKNKDDLVTKVLMRLSDRFNAQIDGIQAQGLNAVDEMYAIAQFIAGETMKWHPSLNYDLAKYHPDACRIADQGKEVEIVEKVARNMEKGVREGLYRPDIDVSLLSKLYVVRFDRAMGDQVAGLLQHRTMAEINWELFRYHIHGIASKKGVDYLEKKLAKAQHVPPSPGATAQNA